MRKLATNYGNYWWHIAIDNFYMNVPLVEGLYGRKIQVTGTVRHNHRHGIPASVKDVRNNVGTSFPSRKVPQLIYLYNQTKIGVDLADQKYTSMKWSEQLCFR